jgi:disulfide bond formation protein DsbB
MPSKEPLLSRLLDGITIRSANVNTILIVILAIIFGAAGCTTFSGQLKCELNPDGSVKSCETAVSSTNVSK